MTNVFVVLNLNTLKYDVFASLQEAMFSCLQWGGRDFHMMSNYTWTVTLSNDEHVTIEQKRVR